jgi:hypothetical protein
MGKKDRGSKEGREGGRGKGRKGGQRELLPMMQQMGERSFSLERLCKAASSLRRGREGARERGGRWVERTRVVVDQEADEMATRKEEGEEEGKEGEREGGKIPTWRRVVSGPLPSCTPPPAAPCLAPPSPYPFPPEVEGKEGGRGGGREGKRACRHQRRRDK